MNSVISKISKIAVSGSLQAPQQLCRALATEANALSRSDLLEKAKEVATTLKQDIPTIVLEPGQGFFGDTRSTSALCVGDDISNHTAKWLQKELGVRICCLTKKIKCFRSGGGRRNVIIIALLFLFVFKATNKLVISLIYIHLPQYFVAGNPDEPFGVCDGGGAH